MHTTKADEKEAQMHRLFGVGIALLGAAFILLGIELVQYRGVFFKAIMICFECIGIG
jgi:hypothetical protein